MAGDKAGASYLLIDVGHVLTHAAYVAKVEGTARLVALAEAGTTGLNGSGDILEGVRRATANLELLIGRHILDAAGDLRRPSDSDGHGVDGVVATTSLARPLRVAIAGLTRDISLASALRATTLPYVSIERTICLETSAHRWDSEDIEALIQNPPDALVIVGGTEGGALAPIRDLGEMLSTAYSIAPAHRRPAVIYAGNAQAQRSLLSAFSGVTEVRLVPNVRPWPEKENLGDLRAAMARLFHQQAVGGSAQLQALSQWADSPVVHDVDMLARSLRFLSRRYRLYKGVLGIDLGGSGTRVLRVGPAGAALTWASPYGTGAGLGALRGLEDPTAIVRWMHHPLSWAEAWDRLSNVEVRPAGVPQTDEDWDLQQAAACEALQRTWATACAAWSDYAADSRRPEAADVLVARGTALSHAQTPGQAALILANALEPSGFVRLSLDWANLLPGLAGLAQRDSLAAVQVLDNDAFLDLGTLVAPTGSARPGRGALKLRMVVRGETRADLSVPAGGIRCLPLGVNERARLEVQPARSLDVGAGRGQGIAAEVRGGALGVIIDARGRPLPVPVEEAARRQALARWQQEIEES